MLLEIIPATPADGTELTEIFYAAFGGEFNRKMFPETPDVTVWWEQIFHDSITRSIAGRTNEVFLKVVDSDQDAIVAFAKWKCPTSAGRDRHEPEESAVWAPSCDGKLCDRFFGGMEELKGKWMGDRPHYYLDMLAVHPSHQGRGLASKLLKWGLARADDEGVEVYLSSSPEGKPVYEKYGFRDLESFSPYPDYVQVCMLRPIKGQ
ncbi:Acyl-CoA N-acyltransferase [Penicillium antarcticum]|uniref:Acyl-CoA N-acyltransferase n=1 Tax=Penicillium antarcticum TaxID=416450 RepID=UPI002383C177|nr:Acyl-CoA N-acyltransferase [Penicillium antarcticum]KAJ5306883.1 Acyl-CoA N-acyltransferase [Penicillium antarcticum]